MTPSRKLAAKVELLAAVAALAVLMLI